jgi:hypothetical protein
LYLISHIISGLSKLSTLESIDTDEDKNYANGALNLLTRFLPHIMDDSALLNELFWSGEGRGKGIALMEALLLLSFKQGFTIKPKPDINTTTNALNLDYLWKAGLKSSPYDV